MYQMKHYCKLLYNFLVFVVVELLVFLKVTGVMCIELFTSGAVLLSVLIF